MGSAWNDMALAAIYQVAKPLGISTKNTNAAKLFGLLETQCTILSLPAHALSIKCIKHAHGAEAVDAVVTLENGLPVLGGEPAKASVAVRWAAGVRRGVESLLAKRKCATFQLTHPPLSIVFTRQPGAVGARVAHTTVTLSIDGSTIYSLLAPSAPDTAAFQLFAKARWELISAVFNDDPCPGSDAPTYAVIHRSTMDSECGFVYRNHSRCLTLPVADAIGRCKSLPLVHASYRLLSPATSGGASSTSPLKGAVGERS
jgi:hypothetical protein